MKKMFALTSCALLALITFAPATAKAVAMPITFTLDNPNQTVMAPSSGFINVDFTGTVTLAPGFNLTTGSIDMAYEATLTKHLDGLFTNAFAIFLNGGTGTFSGAIFNVTVPAGTSIDLYSFNSSGLSSMVTLFGSFKGGSRTLGEGGISASQAFSVKVIGGTVPEGGSSLLLLGLSFAMLFAGRRIFALREERLAA